MLEIVVPKQEVYIEDTNEFAYLEKDQILQLEHSLLSLSKWESRWHKAYLSKQEKSNEETVDYIRCMTITPKVNPETYKFLTAENIRDITAYIEDPMTAISFRSQERQGGAIETPTAEMIYYAMIASNIPFECQKWHLNRLLALIRVCSIKNQPPKKIGQQDLMKRAALNELRKKRLKTRG